MGEGIEEAIELLVDEEELMDDRLAALAAEDELAPSPLDFEGVADIERDPQEWVGEADPVGLEILIIRRS